MMRIYLALIPAMWLAWLAYWIIASFGAKATRRRESPLSRATYLVPLLLGAFLLSSPRPLPAWLDSHVVPPSMPELWLGIVLVAGGLAVAVWARRHIAGYWSGTVTLKEDHQLIRTGPYGWVRHPIYSGVLLAIAGTVVALDEWRGVVALLLMTASFWRKLLIEESWLGAAFPDQYPRYRAEVSALIPGVL